MMDARRQARVAARQTVAAAATAATGGSALWLRVAVPLAVTVAALAGGLVLLVLLAAVGGPPAPAAAAADALGIHPVVLAAYLQAEHDSRERVGCRVRWAVLAGIGKVESDHARQRDPGTDIRPDGTVSPPIIGPRLDGSGGTARIPDTDRGRWDLDTVYDRAVGPMQFIPGSWRRFGQDATGNGTAEPHNVFDAALAAAAHLCQAPAPPAGGRDLDDPRQLAEALFAYNRSHAYVATVLGWINHYDAFHIDADGAVITAGVYTLPVDRDLVTPALLVRPHHTYPAWDLALPEGTPVYAVHAGTVVSVTTRASRCGLGVVVAGDDGYTYIYCHASVVLVEWGQRVTAGQQVMASGNTGNSTGPHLHLGIRDAAGADRCPQDVLVAWYDGVAASPGIARASGCTY
jgi:murein DD-endopeptidase MepM/ murein hydrolase activator NlpD